MGMEAQRKEWHTLTPADVIAKLVRTYAKNVRSDTRWSRAVLPEFLRVQEGPNRL